MIRLRIIIARCYYLFDNYHEYGIFHCIVHKKKHQLKTNKLHRLINDDEDWKKTNEGRKETTEDGIVRTIFLYLPRSFQYNDICIYN
jgi:hypothetical protein